MKLYRYRPVSSFLFKELKYKEIYLARYGELNDPQDLSCSVNYYSNEKDKVIALGNFLHRKLVHAHGIIAFLKIRDEFTPEKLGKFLFDKFHGSNDELVTDDDLHGYLAEYYRLNIEDDTFTSFDKPHVKQLFEAIAITTNHFLKNASVACFTETNSNFLMWSHYAGGHNGVCLEFEAELFNISNFEKRERLGILTSVEFMYEGRPMEFWTEINQVKYQPKIPTIDFYELYHALVNVGDIDLMELSKSRWHGYADYIKTAFLHKLTPWCTEKEWRIVQVDFKDSMPEDRIIKYSEKSLKSVCFGSSVNAYTQLRIGNLLGSDVLYQKSVLNGTDQVEIVSLDMERLRDSYISA